MEASKRGRADGVTGTQPRRDKRARHQSGHTLDKFKQSLPIYQHKQNIINTVRLNRAVVLVGETGSGKTTQLPQYLVDAGLVSLPKQLIVTQPRRVAAITVARRVATEMRTFVGGKHGKVGYSVRFEDMTGPGTVIKFATDGILMREAQSDPLLSRYAVVVLDEAHERSLATDVLFGIVKLAMARRPDLRVVVMSATLDVGLYAEYFAAAVLQIPGRQHPVDVFYAGEPQESHVDAAATSVLQLHVDKGLTRGDILVFLTGQEDVNDVTQMLESKAAAISKLIARAKAGNAAADGALLELRVCPLYGSLSHASQLRAFEPVGPDCRKVILATNIAETSVTINGVRYVIDSGKLKVRAAGAGTGMESLDTVDVAKSQALQRCGRAGREAPGECYRLYTEASYLALAATPVPEVKRISIASVLLQLLSMGMTGKEAVEFPWLEQPPADSLRRGIALLTELKAIAAQSDGFVLTPAGSKMAALPLEPVYASLVLTAAALGCGMEAIATVALLSSENVWVSPGHEKTGQLDEARKKFTSIEGDHVTLLNVFNSFEKVVISAAQDVKDSLQRSATAAANGGGIPVVTFDSDEEAADVSGAGALGEWMPGTVKKANPRPYASAADAIVAAVRTAKAQTPAGGDPRRAARGFIRQINDRVLKWCHEYFLSVRALRKAVAIRDQLYDVCDQLGLKLTSCGKDMDVFRKALAVGCFINVAVRSPALEAGRAVEYRTRDKQSVYVHPSSTLVLAHSHIRNKQGMLANDAAKKGVVASPSVEGDMAWMGYPDMVVYAEVVKTNKPYMRYVTRIERAWLADVMPDEFGAAA